MADIIVGGQVGEVRGSAGVGTTMRQGPYSEIVVNDAGTGRFLEATRYGRVFYTYSQAITIAATHNTPLAAATGTAIVGALNQSTNKIMSILGGYFTSVSGTPGTNAQPVWNAALVGTAITAATTGTIVPGLIGGAASSMKALNNIALAGLNAAASNLVAVRPFNGAANVGALAANHDYAATDLVDGAILVPPGAFIGIFAGTAAGTTWIVNAGMWWAELDSSIVV